MIVNSYVVQLDRKSFPARMPRLARVDYDALLDSLKYPVLWVYDPYLNTYLPSEVDHAFLTWLQNIESLDEAAVIAAKRMNQLYKTCLISSPIRVPIKDLRKKIDRSGFVKIPKLVNGAWSSSMFSSYYWRNDHLLERWADMPGIKRTSVNNLPLSRFLHQAVEPVVCSLVPDRIKTSYSFTSSYEAGSNLPAHRDRPQCVYNISLMLSGTPGNKSLAGWPLYIQRNGVDNKIELETGDGVFYSGTRDLHWRETMPAELSGVLGVFMHFVPEDFQGSLD